jgi:ABC-2 type transport system ATP-binding protein
VIEVQGLSHSFGKRGVLFDVTCEVPAGSVVGLVGPNGAGKTTLMRCLVTLLAPTTGTVRVADLDVHSHQKQVRAAVGYLPERASPYPELLSWEYLDFFAEVAGHKAEERRRRVEASLAAAGIPDRANTATRELSKGLRQRLALQAVLMHDPQVLVLDEPTDGLDPESRDLMLRQVRDLANTGKAVLLSSHVLAEVEEVAGQVLILVDGRLSQQQSEGISRRFVIRLRGEPATAVEWIRRLPEVAAVTCEGEGLLVELAPAVPDAAAVIAALVAAQIPVVEVRQDKDTLRRRFARAVEQARKDAGS